jgi:pyruvate,orthophosphate dikinase
VASLTGLAAAAGVTPEAARRITDAGAEAGDLSESRDSRFRLLPAGRARLAAGLAQERADVDRPAVMAIYERFLSFNQEFKALVTRWQMKPDGTLNDHADTRYDRDVLRELDEIHGPFVALVAELGVQMPRLGSYRRRFEAAFARVSAGDTTWLGRPLIDSYHTVWFELHEDLLSLCGLERGTEEAAAG